MCGWCKHVSDGASRHSLIGSLVPLQIDGGGGAVSYRPAGIRHGGFLRNAWPHDTKMRRGTDPGRPGEFTGCAVVPAIRRALTGEGKTPPRHSPAGKSCHHRRLAALVLSISSGCAVAITGLFVQMGSWKGLILKRLLTGPTVHLSPEESITLLTGNTATGLRAAGAHGSGLPHDHNGAL